MIKILISIFLIFLPLFSLSDDIISCQIYTEKYNSIYKLPNKLLTSISLVESGKVEGNKVNSWPWALNVDGKSKYFDNKKDTLSFLEKNLQKNINIDVGCMQINYKFHGHNFKNLDHILNPEENVKYAAEFLKNYLKDINHGMRQYPVIILLNQLEKKDILQKYEIFGIS